ncbi:hypothetical protein ACLKA7_007055 [Drosophila subpalustris]
MRRDETIQSMIKIEVIDDNWTQLKGEICGPKNTPYEGGRFSLELKVPEGYPFCAPNVRFVTRIWHPNISFRTGSICNDILKDNWAAVMTLPSVLLSLQALLSDAEPDEPHDSVVNFQYKQAHEIFLMTAKHWTNAYAGGPHKIPQCDSKILNLKEMGVDEDEARIVLSKENWDLENAIECLFH